MKFVSDQTAAIKIDGAEETVYIRERLNLGQLQRVQSAAPMALGGAPNVSIMSAMWEAYIVRWENVLDEAGKTIPCTPANIARLDPDDPLVVAVSDAIAARWRAQTGEETSRDERVKN